MKLTLAFITGRAQPGLDWLIDSLMPQIGSTDKIEILVIDRLGRSPDQLGVSASIAQLTTRSAPPKPSPWQGPHRITSCDWWAKSSAINTAFVLCDTDYIAFVDDRCRLGSKWLETVRRGERDRASVLAGTYDKIERGVALPDHRRGLAPSGKLNCGGGWLYGCTFALPLEWALEVNGAEEGCDGLGAEDYIFGFLLENNGRRIDFVPELAVVQERPETSVPGTPSIALRRADKGIAPNDKSNAALARFRMRKRTEFAPDLRALRKARKAGKLSWPMPDPDLRDWYDGQLVREMK